MAGYVGYSMSVNAKRAYNNGLMPLSKWSKDELCLALEEIYKDYNINFWSYSKRVLSLFLEHREWHHTSKHYNCTDFYGINEDLSKEEVMEILNTKFEKKEKVILEEKRVKVKYIEWAGSYKHPRAIHREDTGTLKGNWIFLDKGGKKNINGNYVKYEFI